MINGGRRRHHIVAVASLAFLAATGSSNAEPAVSQQHTTCGAEMRSNRTSCAEEDNVNVPLYAGKAVQFRVTATHPLYPVGTDTCQADFSGCLSGAGLRSAQVADVCERILDDGLNVVQVCTAREWWRPFTMNVVTEGGRSSAGHYLVLSRKIQGEASWPQFLVLYEDSNVRLKPHPRQGTTDNCFGSSILIGPLSLAPDRSSTSKRLSLDRPRFLWILPTAAQRRPHISIFPWTVHKLL